MDLMHDLLLATHVGAGLLALVTFWIPALTRKGSPRHRRAGRWYAAAMAFITVSGVLLALLFLAGERWQSGVFLLFLGLITGTSLWNGWRVLRAKRDPAAYATRLHTGVAMLNVLAGLALIAFGIALGRPLFYAFGPVGLLIGGGMLAVSLRRPDDPKYWLYEHLTGMIGSGIAAHVAFLVFGGRQLFAWATGGFGLVLWIAPVAIGTIAIVALNVHYRRGAVAPREVSPRSAPTAPA